MCSTVFGAPDVTMVFVNRCNMWAATFGASDEGFGSFTIGDEVAKA
jgi:hypothetical protein